MFLAGDASLLLLSTCVKPLRQAVAIAASLYCSALLAPFRMAARPCPAGGIRYQHNRSAYVTGACMESRP